jgi:hypothetical protein
MTPIDLNPFGYDADAKDRIWRLLEVKNVGYRDRLKQSADTAGAQLEWLKPHGGTERQFLCWFSCYGVAPELS